MSVTYPRGFRAAAVTAGFKSSCRPDLGLLVGDPGTTAAGLFTTNRVQAAPVRLSRERLGAGRARAVLVNSGQANAATGARGDADAVASTAAAAEHLALAADEVLPCSTGVIGEPLHLPQLRSALPGLVGSLTEGGGDAFAEAIMTTDTVPKVATADAGACRVGGCAKGSGMISPRLATMLAFVTTDAAVSAGDLHRLAEACLAPSFNALTIDACPSTNDTVLLFASGASGSDPIVPGSAAWDGLALAVAAVGETLAHKLVQDAEGGTRVLVVDVEGAADDVAARTVARAVADSPLVKTALFGGDPNPGRILQAVGASGVALDADHLDVSIGTRRVVEAGSIPGAYFDSNLRELAAIEMKEPVVRFEVRVGDGPGRARVLGCDLSYEYVRINGEYTT